MIYKVYTFQYEVNKFLYDLGKGHQQYNPSTRNILIEGSLETNPLTQLK